MTLELLDVPEGHPLRDAILALRTRVLRVPLGLQFTPEQLAADAGNIYLAALVEGKLAGCIQIATYLHPCAKFRQMAVDATYQGQGIGQQLVAYAENFAAQHGYTSVELHARESALGFYKKAGYEAIGETFTEVTIPHRRMVKTLP